MRPRQSQFPTPDLLCLYCSALIDIVLGGESRSAATNLSSQPLLLF